MDNSLSEKKEEDKKAKQKSKNGDSKSMDRLVVYVYDPLSSSCVDEIDPWRNSEESRKRYELAAEMSMSSNYVWSLKSCLMALRYCKQNINDACLWLSDRNNELISRRRIPLVRRLLLPHILPELNPDALNACMKIVTGHQLVLVGPPYYEPWSYTEQHFVRVYALFDSTTVTYDPNASNKTLVYSSSENSAPPSSTSTILHFGKLKANLKAFCRTGIYLIF